MMLLGMGRSATRKVAAPLSAAGAALVVYFAGSSLLGVDGSVALSRAVNVPEVPDLGTLPEDPSALRTKVTPRAGAEAKDESAPKKPTEMQVEMAPMPEGLSWPGKGLVEVVTSEDELIYVDDVFTGRGPLRRVPVSPGSHEISIKSGAITREGTVSVSPNQTTRAVFKSE
jgi:hypothetical protein